MGTIVNFCRRFFGFVRAFFQCLYRSIRVEVHGGDRNAQCIIAFWHGEQLCLYGGVPSSPCVAPVSKSKDGELQVGVLRSFGIAAVRGSSSSGSLGVLRQLVRCVQGGVSSSLRSMDLGTERIPKPGSVLSIKEDGRADFASTCGVFSLDGYIALGIRCWSRVLLVES